MFKDEDEDDNLAFSSGYAFVYDNGTWYLCGKAHGDETQNDALNAALNLWIEALPEDQRAALKQVMV